MRRFVWRLCVAFAVLCAGASAVGQGAGADLPIVFVHGNGDDAAKWIGVVWLFESNGYPANHLYSIRFTNPMARGDDTREEPFRSSTVDAAAELSAMVTRALLETGSTKVVLIGSSRGGLTMRNYIVHGGRQNVAAAILAGTPNHGVVSSERNVNNEFNAKSVFLRGLNGPAGSTEVVEGVRFMTLRSDSLDKYAQPPSANGGVGYDGPELRGAENVVLPQMDHRELAFYPTAFAAMYRFITGRAPKTLTVTPVERPMVWGVVTGFAGLAPTNLPMAGVHLRVYAVGGSTRPSTPVYETTTKEDGRWGPMEVSSKVEYEFDLEYGGRHVRYFKAPLMRSTLLLNLRFIPVPQGAETGPQVLVARPQGYFSRDRDPVLVNGAMAPEEPVGLPLRDSFFVKTPADAAVRVQLRGETITLWPSSQVATDLPVVDFLW